MFDSYKFVSRNYHSIVWHYKSIDTWLEGVCRSWCPEHPWVHSKITWAPGKKSIFNEDEDDDLNAPDLDGEDGTENDLFYLGQGNNGKLVADALMIRGLKQMDPGLKFSDSFRFKWVQTLKEINFSKLVPGRHLVNHIPNIPCFTNKTSTLETIENLKISLQTGLLTSDLKVDQFWPETYKLDSVSHLADFLRNANDGLWILKKSHSNCGRGI